MCSKKLLKVSSLENFIVSLCNLWLCLDVLDHRSFTLIIDIYILLWSLVETKHYHADLSSLTDKIMILAQGELVFFFFLFSGFVMVCFDVYLGIGTLLGCRLCKHFGALEWRNRNCSTIGRRGTYGNIFIDEWAVGEKFP